MERDIKELYQKNYKTDLKLTKYSIKSLPKGNYIQYELVIPLK